MRAFGLVSGIQLSGQKRSLLSLLVDTQRVLCVDTIDGQEGVVDVLSSSTICAAVVIQGSLGVPCLALLVLVLFDFLH